MTRFARMGAGNPKVPLEASSWDKIHKKQNSNRHHGNVKSKEKKVKQKANEYNKNIKKDTKNLKLSSDLVSEIRQFDFGTNKEKQEFITYVKKEQRSKERRLKRIEKRADEKVCYNCRKPGHQISDCPKVKKDVEQGTGICFKCGSTEHTSTQCRLKLPPGEFPFAKCFICGETGHLSSSCQDNPRGLYPNGGCCNTCGSVEHYKRDCPEHQAKQGISSTTLATLDNTQSADAELSLHVPKPVIRKKTGPKLVKF